VAITGGRHERLEDSQRSAAADPRALADQLFQPVILPSLSAMQAELVAPEDNGSYPSCLQGIEDKYRFDIPKTWSIPASMERRRTAQAPWAYYSLSALCIVP
jgi:hypothetical protein